MPGAMNPPRWSPCGPLPFLMAAGACFLAIPANAADWRPEKRVEIIVPSGANRSLFFLALHYLTHVQASRQLATLWRAARTGVQYLPAAAHEPASAARRRRRR